ncbi:FAD-dependent oxidoreductase [Xylanivirga thermophila]|uniref:FAD-dependent oxidoreductase n=1 Tax=Xylanivirga thermophila TaxID=2496273 RepID=UPI00101DAB38|nr:FAD-dependent oxidoreductase [Xylanivirga thermophila]
MYPKKILIVGGVAGGASTAARLRRMDEEAEIVLFERGEYISFANCGLPYYVGDIIKDREALFVQTPQGMSRRFNIDVRVNSEVIHIDSYKKQVEVLDHVTGITYDESYDRLVLSPGANPIKPSIPGIDRENVFVVRNIPDTFRITNYIQRYSPKKAAVIGGGFIGLEMAENLMLKGLDVSLIEMANQVMPPIDYDMAAFVHPYMKQKGIRLYLSDGAQEIKHNNNKTIIKLRSGEQVEADLIVLAIGVKPDVTLAKDAALEIGPTGGIRVDKYLRTSDPDIYAIGDAVEVMDFVNGHPAVIPLAGPANKQGRIVANNICGIEDAYDGTQGTSIVKLFDMVIASTGNNEKILKKYDIPYIRSYTHSPSHAGYYPGAGLVSIKLLFRSDDGRILGAQIIGSDGVDKRIDVLSTAIRAGLTVYDLEELELAYAPPFSSAKDPVNMAGYVAANILKGDHPVIYWDEIDDLTDEQVIVDVRTGAEYGQGAIPGAWNIPLDTLRDRIDELPRDKEIIIYCRVGLRGYLAARILMQNGFKVRNLSGGYITYKITH